MTKGKVLITQPFPTIPSSWVMLIMGKKLHIQYSTLHRLLKESCLYVAAPRLDGRFLIS